MVKIRLQRVGATKKPSYRVVVADSRSPRDGSFIEVIGHYDPLTDPATIVIKQEKRLTGCAVGLYQLRLWPACSADRGSAIN